MRVKNVVLLGIVTLASAMIFSVTSPAAPRAKAAPVAAQPATAAVPAAEPAPVPPHPEIRDALDALHRAQVHLREAKHDFGGHREDALHATDEAIRQLQICLKYD